jgi:ATPase family associated with various cellular activities (AAA)
MYITIEKDLFVNHIVSQFPEESEIREQGKSKLRGGSTKLDLEATLLEWEDLEKLYEIAKEQKDKSVMRQVTQLKNLLENIEESKIGNLKALAVALVAYFSEDVIDGWIYRIDRDGVPNPYLITGIYYREGYRDSPAYTEIKMVANSARNSGEKLYETTISFDTSDIYAKSIPALLAKNNLYHETVELKETYEKHFKLFEDYQPQFNKQFLLTGDAFEDYRYSSEIKLSKSRGVNDEALKSRKFTTNYSPEFWRRVGEEEHFDNVPFHCYIYLFDLNIHRHVWVHTSNMKPYVYNTGLRDKLVLPQHHRDLIDILVEDMNLLMEDIIEGKSGGTTILSVGKPGLGKTLSAEVYSEVVQRPLYKVHSGQLGLTADAVEKSLETILKRASRWGAVLLLDEADVYIRARGNDLQHNAVVAGFLRTLEYFDGLLFMTTNRGDDVDDAILSRCIAVIKYETPSTNDAKKIWRVLSNQFKVEISDSLIDELVIHFPTASGRDIKELLKLTSRYAKGKNVELDIEVFRQCAQFRGVEFVEADQ